MVPRSTGVYQPDDRSCIPSCIATFLGHDRLRNPLQKVGRDGDLCADDNKTLLGLGCKIEKVGEIPDSGSCLVLAKHRAGSKHCFLFDDGSFGWDPTEGAPSPRCEDWTVVEVWKLSAAAI